jgi:hypothetical protein
VWRNKSVDPKGSDTEVDKLIMTIYLQILSLDGKQWIDYLVPHCIGAWIILASYSKLLRWWSENSTNTAIS